MESQEKPTKFTCIFCNKAYKTKASLLHHLDSVHFLRNKIFNCDRPKKQNRKKEKSKEKPTFWQCDYCQQYFSSASNRTRHMKTTHQKNTRGEEVPIKKFTCVDCNKAYTSKASLQHHLDSVHFGNIKIFKCDRPNCSYKSDHKGILNRHIQRVHRPRPNLIEKPKIECGKCPSSFTSRSSLRRHEKIIHKDIHPPNIKRKCPLCPFNSMEKTKKEIIEHFEKYHSLNISTQKHSFADLEKFNEWKDQLQTNTSATFVKASSNQPRYLYFICHRRGYFKTKGHNIRHIKRSGSCKINGYCPSEIHAKINQNGSVSVVYYPTHVGHKNDLKFMRLPAADKKVIVSQLLSKTPHEEILKRLRWTPLKNNELQRIHLLNKKDLTNMERSLNINSEELSHKFETNNELQRIHLLNKKDLTNMERSLNINSEEMTHKFDPVSVEAWVNEFTTNQNTALIVYKPQGLYNPAYPQLKEDDFLLIFMTKAQQSLLTNFGQNTIYIDGTHGVNNFNFQLYTLLTLDETREGVPCAFMFTNRGDESTLSLFFESIKSVTGPITPKIFMSDIEEAFYSAWSRAMGEAGLRLFCTWHVLRAWRANLNKIKNKEKKETVYKMLKTLLYELDCHTFQNILLEALNILKSDLETTEYHNYFYNYYVKNEKSTFWAYCYRTDAGINTNMNLENFNRVLKYCYLRGKMVQSLDKTLNAVLNLITDKLFDYMIKIEKGKLVNKLQILRRRHKNALLIPENSVIKDNTKWTVLSESNNEFYCVKKVQDCKQCQLQCLHCRSCFHEYICTCLDNSIKNNMCEHIHAVCRTMINDCVATTEDTEEFIMDVEDDINKINTKHTVLMEISNSTQSNKMCKEDLEILWKQLLESTSTNKEINLVKKTLKEAIATVNAMKTTANPPIVVHQAEDGNYYVVEEDVDGSKQMLSVSEDGAVEMVEVMWDEMETADENMQFSC